MTRRAARDGRPAEEQEADARLGKLLGEVIELRAGQADATTRALRQTLTSPTFHSDEQHAYLVAALAIAEQLAYANAIALARMTDGQ